MSVLSAMFASSPLDASTLSGGVFSSRVVVSMTTVISPVAPAAGVTTNLETSVFTAASPRPAVSKV